MAKRQQRNNGADDDDGDNIHRDDPDFEEEGPSPALNSAARAEIIREAHLTLSDFEAQIKGLKAEAKAIIETRIVAGLGMKKRDFAHARALIEMDQEERDALQDTIRETFAALGVGQQLNWLDATEGERADA
jgi:hypothetical protein